MFHLHNATSSINPCTRNWTQDRLHRGAAVLTTRPKWTWFSNLLPISRHIPCTFFRYPVCMGYIENVGSQHALLNSSTRAAKQS
jgi:hypothetical protein